MSRRCKNCDQWSSTDRIWGECIYMEREHPDQKAHATYVERMGDVRDARLETRFDFGCSVWATKNRKQEAPHG